MKKIRIEKTSITEASTDCIVNAANEQLMGGTGVCGAIFKAAGWNRLQNACDAIGHCDTGSAVITPAFRLNAKYIIHAVGPVWKDGKHKEPQKLYSCYKASLNLAKEYNCHSIAFPLISAGVFGYPKDQAWRKALQACIDFLQNNPDYDIDILFAVLDHQILKMGLDELKAQSKDVTGEHPLTSEDDLLLEKLDGKALREAIESVRTAGEVSWQGGKKENGIIQLPFPVYSDGVWESFSVLEPDYGYMEHYKQDCKDVLPSEMTARQIRTMLTYMSRGERFCDGLVAGYLKDRTLLKLLLRLDDLLIRYYQKHKLPAEARYNNPVFWYETDQKHNPMLVKGNGERLTLSEKSDMSDQLEQSQQGFLRAMLFMDLNEIWDATGFGATMSATLSFGPDEGGKLYTFTSCQEAEKELYHILTAEQVIECRKNVDDFYADPRLQMLWKEVILHPVCMILKQDGSMEPAAFSGLDPAVLVQNQYQPIQIGERKSYEWLFGKDE